MEYAAQKIDKTSLGCPAGFRFLGLPYFVDFKLSFRAARKNLEQLEVRIIIEFYPYRIPLNLSAAL